MLIFCQMYHIIAFIYYFSFYDCTTIFTNKFFFLKRHCCFYPFSNSFPIHCCVPGRYKSKPTLHVNRIRENICLLYSTYTYLFLSVRPRCDLFGEFCSFVFVLFRTGRPRGCGLGLIFANNRLPSKSRS